MLNCNPKRCSAILPVVALILALGLTVPGQSPAAPTAGELFHRGQFDEAACLYKKMADQDPACFEALAGLARISLLRNNLDDAAVWLKRAMELRPQEVELHALTGELLCRRDEYFQAAPFFETAGRKAKAEKMRAFQDKKPFEMESGPDQTTLPFIQTDPLPMIKVTVNGQEGTFLIDTGAWELHVMPEFAEKCGLKPLTEKETGIYAGGRQASSANSVADQVVLGEFTLRNVPVVIPDRARSPFRADGIVGTVVLYHFIFTLDYPAGRLILRRNTPEMSRLLHTGADAAGDAVVPIWLAGDHFIYTRGTVNGTGPHLLLVDTGMAGGGFTCPEYMLKEAHIELPKAGFQGMGGGGPLTVYPFTASLGLGKIRRDNVQGLYGALPPGFEQRHGFLTGGLISHGFFRPFAVTFDFLAMTLTLHPSN
jgi:hypothetical protein